MLTRRACQKDCRGIKRKRDDINRPTILRVRMQHCNPRADKETSPPRQVGAKFSCLGRVGAYLHIPGHNEGLS